MIDISTLTPDFMLISHGHGDHVADAVSIAKASKCQVIAPFEVGDWLMKQGVENTVPMNPGGTVSLETASVKMVNALHSSSLPDGSYGGNATGFVVHSDVSTFYYAGDTALSYDMKLIAEETEIDFAILPVGGHFTMDYKDAAKAAQFVNTTNVIGMHFDTFPPITINHQEAKEYYSQKELSLILPEINQTLEL
jgi:L-ascorbate metabolism protein UlaG (beta-lactamase superfamily)